MLNNAQFFFINLTRTDDKGRTVLSAVDVNIPGTSTVNAPWGSDPMPASTRLPDRAKMYTGVTGTIGTTWSSFFGPLGSSSIQRPQDAPAGPQPEPGASFGAVVPAGWRRVVPPWQNGINEALNRWTYTEHSPQGPVRIEHSPDVTGKSEATLITYIQLRFGSGSSERAEMQVRTAKDVRLSAPGAVDGVPGSHGQVDTLDESGLKDSRVVRWKGPAVVESWVSADSFPTTGVWSSTSGGNIADRTSLGSMAQDGQLYLLWEDVRKLDIARDESGTPRELSIKDGNASGEPTRSTEVLINNLGEVSRTEHPDGTITRNVYDFRGQLLRVYRGTADGHAYWGTTEPLQSGQTWCEWAAGPAVNDNLVLTESRSYGSGFSSTELAQGVQYISSNQLTHDAYQITRVRKFHDRVPNQYNLDPSTCLTPAANQSWDPGSSLTEYRYDRRVRQSEVRQYGIGVNHATPAPDQAVMLQTVTWFDHQDRPVVVATYGPGTTLLPVTSSLHPRSRSVGSVPPSALAILQESDPLTLSETVYNARGGVYESREYKQDGDSNEYMSTRTFYDYMDRPIRVVRPNGREDRTVYNAIDQMVAQVEVANPPDAATPAAAIDVERTSFEYDGKGNQVIRRSLVRVDNTSGEPRLVAGVNAVESVTYSWYDAAGRAVATAELGTNTQSLADNHPDHHRFITSPGVSFPALTGENAILPLVVNLQVADVPRRGHIIAGQATEVTALQPLCVPPTWSKARVTRFGYDKDGRQVIVIHPSGAATETMYSRFGDVTSVVEWASAAQDTALRVTAYGYDSAGRLTHIASLPNDTASSIRDMLVPGSTGWGRYVSAPPGATGAQPGLQVWFPNTGSASAHRQITEIRYGAVVVNRQGQEFTPQQGYGPDAKSNRHNGWIGTVLFPDPQTGLPSNNPRDQLQFKYLIGGEVFERRDGRGIGIQHTYDAMGRRVATRVVGSSGQPFTIDSELSTALGHPQHSRPTDMVASMTFVYDALGRLTSARSFGPSSQPSPPALSQSDWRYDEWGNLVEDAHLYGPEGPDRPRMVVGYDWTTAPQNVAPPTGIRRNTNRLSAIRYPDRVHNPAVELRRRIQFDYSSSVDNGLSRIRALFDQPNSAASLPSDLNTLRQVALFGYVGSDTRVRTEYNRPGSTTAQPNPAPAVVYDLGAFSGSNGVGVRGLDAHGRLRDMRWGPAGAWGVAPTVRRQSLAYDASANIRASVVETSSPTPGFRGHSWSYGYDRLNRLTGAVMGTPVLQGQLLEGSLNTVENVHTHCVPGSPVQIPSVAMETQTPLPLNFAWTLDPLGNWAGGTWSSGAPPSVVEPGLRVTGNIMGDDVDRQSNQTHRVSSFNAIEESLLSWGLHGPGASVQTLHAHFIRDAAGNLLADDRYLYLYDAFNRLVLVRQRGSMATPATGPPQPILNSSSAWAGTPGPVIVHYMHDALNRVVRSQRPEVPTAAPGITYNRIERHAYDGQRRLATVRVDQQLSTTGEESQSRVKYDGDTPSGPAQVIATVFEYVWGPGNGLGGVDELVGVFQGEELTTPLLDHAGSVVGWVNAAGQVIEHRVFDPYGRVARRIGVGSTEIPVGHQGLIHETLDYAQGTNHLGLPSGPRLFEPWSRHVVLNRSRAYLAPGSLGGSSLASTAVPLVRIKWTTVVWLLRVATQKCHGT